MEWLRTLLFFEIIFLRNHFLDLFAFVRIEFHDHCWSSWASFSLLDCNLVLLLFFINDPWCNNSLFNSLSLSSFLSFPSLRRYSCYYMRLWNIFGIFFVLSWRRFIWTRARVWNTGLIWDRFSYNNLGNFKLNGARVVIIVTLVKQRSRRTFDVRRFFCRLVSRVVSIFGLCHLIQLLFIIPEGTFSHEASPWTGFFNGISWLLWYRCLALHIATSLV